MDDDAKGILGNIDATGERIRRAWEQASVAAMRKHRETGVPVATWDWENGKVLMIPAEEIVAADDHALAGITDPEQQP
jgi:hypothetical protein